MKWSCSFNSTLQTSNIQRQGVTLTFIRDLFSGYSGKCVAGNNLLFPLKNKFPIPVAKMPTDVWEILFVKIHIKLKFNEAFPVFDPEILKHHSDC